MARLTGNTVATNPQTGAIVQLSAGEEVPSWAEVGEHLLEPTAETVGDVVPPKGGAGSGRDAWAAYAEVHDVEVGNEATREDIIAALESADVPTE